MPTIFLFFKTEIEVCYNQVTDADSYDITKP